MINIKKELAGKDDITRMLQGLNEARNVRRPHCGWLRLARSSSQLSAGEVARRMGVSRHLPLQFEKAEVEDGITLRSLRSMADAMGFDLVYGLIPKCPPKSTTTPAVRNQPAQKSQTPISKTGPGSMTELLEFVDGLKPSAGDR